MYIIFIKIFVSLRTCAETTATRCAVCVAYSTLVPSTKDIAFFQRRLVLCDIPAAFGLAIDIVFALDG